MVAILAELLYVCRASVPRGQRFGAAGLLLSQAAAWALMGWG